MTIESLDFLDPDVKDYINSALINNGPWIYKRTLKEKTNCCLNFMLAGLGDASLEIREYLNNNDPDEAWMRSMVEFVSPFIRVQYLSNIDNEWEIRRG